MPTLRDVFVELAGLQDEGLINAYAIGGAMAALFYAEPTRTYDLDVFVDLPRTSATLASLAPIYQWAASKGFTAHAEHIVMHGVPVPFLPAFNALVTSAISAARFHDYLGVSVPVADPEHLVALALQAGGARRRERAWLLLEAGVVDRSRLQALLSEHGIAAELPDDI